MVYCLPSFLQHQDRLQLVRAVLESFGAQLTRHVLTLNLPVIIEMIVVMDKMSSVVVSIFLAVPARVIKIWLNEFSIRYCFYPETIGQLKELKS